MALKTEKERRFNEWKIKYFVPYKEQEDFIRSKAKERLILGANRTGKSEIGALEAISYCLGYRPYLKRNDPDYYTPFKAPIRGLITTESLGIEGTAQQTIVPKLEEWIPKSELVWTRKNQQGVTILYGFKNKSTLVIMAYEQDTAKFEGPRYHFWFADEPFPKDKYSAISRGLTDFGGYAWFAMTLLSQKWIWDALYTKEKVFKLLVPMEANLKRKRIWYGREVDTGGLEQIDIDDLKEKYLRAGIDEGEVEARLTGRPKHLSGAIISNFDYDKHCIDPFDLPNDWTFYEAIDCHPKKPYCIVFMAVNPKNVKYIYKVIYIRDIIPNICEAILIERKKRKPRMTLIDPLAVTESPQTKTTIIDDFIQKSKGEIYPIVATKDKERGVNLIREAFTSQPEYGIQPNLFIFNTEQEAINQLRNWSYHKETEKFGKEDDDFPENLYRLMLVAQFVSKQKLTPDKKIQGIGFKNN